MIEFRRKNLRAASRRIRKAPIGAAVLAGVALIAACSSGGQSSGSAAASGGTYNVEIVASLTGVGGSQQAVDGYEAVIDQVNADGGIAGHKIKFQVLDDQSSATVSASVARQAIAANPTAILDGSTSTYYTPRVPAYMSAKIPVIAASATGFTPFIYTVNQTVNQTAASIANMAAAALGGSLAGHKVASVAVASPLGEEINSAASTAVSKAGGTMVDTEVSPIGAPSFPAAAKLVADNPDVIVLNNIASDAVVVAKALVGAGYHGKILLNYTAADDTTMKAIGVNDVLGFRLLEYPVPGTAMYQTAQKFNLTAGTQNGGLLFGVAWAQAYMLVDALKACAYPCKSDALIKALNSLGTFTVPGAMQYASFSINSSKHNAETGGQLFQWNQSDASAAKFGGVVSIGPPDYSS